MFFTKENLKESTNIHYKMSTKYIILTKDERDATDNNQNNQIFFTNKPLTYLMPAVNHTYYSERGLFENNLIEWCKQFCNKDSTFLDIGAHTGSYAISLAPYAAKVIAFEPQRMTYYALCGGVALSGATNVECMKIGLGNADQVGPLTLHIVSNDGGGSTVHAPSSDKVLNSETIEIQTLDSLNIQSKISFIKMDVEENELHVLQGGMETIVRTGYPKILFESNSQTNTALFDYLREILGYQIIKVSGFFNMYLAERTGI
jgi:FkbM family methyltransferase